MIRSPVASSCPAVRRFVNSSCLKSLESVIGDVSSLELQGVNNWQRKSDGQIRTGHDRSRPSLRKGLSSVIWPLRTMKADCGQALQQEAAGFYDPPPCRVEKVKIVHNR